MQTPAVKRQSDIYLPQQISIGGGAVDQICILLRQKGFSRPIGAFFHVSHGLSSAMLLPAVTAYTAQKAPQRSAEMARHLGLASRAQSDAEAVAALVGGLDAFVSDLEVPSPRVYGIEQQAWSDRIPTMVDQALESGSPADNPHIPAAADVAALYQAVCF